MAHAYLAFQDVERGALALRGPPKSWREGGRAATLIGPLPSRTDYPPGTPSKPRQNPPGGTVACSRSCAASIADAGALAVSCRTERTGASRRQPRCRTAALTPRGLGKRPLLGVGRRTPLFARAKIRVGVTEWGGVQRRTVTLLLSTSAAAGPAACSDAAQQLSSSSSAALPMALDVNVVRSGTQRSSWISVYHFPNVPTSGTRVHPVVVLSPAAAAQPTCKCRARPAGSVYSTRHARTRSCIRSTTLPTRSSSTRTAA